MEEDRHNLHICPRCAQPLANTLGQHGNNCLLCSDNPFVRLPQTSTFQQSIFTWPYFQINLPLVDDTLLDIILLATTGLEDIISAPPYKLVMLPNEETCAICLEALSGALELPCEHRFHSACIGKWLERAHTCPTCRAVASSS